MRFAVLTAPRADCGCCRAMWHEERVTDIELVPRILGPPVWPSGFRHGHSLLHLKRSGLSCEPGNPPDTDAAVHRTGCKPPVGIRAVNGKRKPDISGKREFNSLGMSWFPRGLGIWDVDEATKRVHRLETVDRADAEALLRTAAQCADYGTGIRSMVLSFGRDWMA